MNGCSYITMLHMISLKRVLDSSLLTSMKLGFMRDWATRLQMKYMRMGVSLI